MTAATHSSNRARTVAWRFRFWRKHWLWIAIALFGGVSVVLGFWGFSIYFRATGQTRSFFDLLYFVLSPFFVEGGEVDGPVPWQVQAATCYPDAEIPSRSMEIKNDLLAVREKIGAEQVGMVLCPRLDDRHQDHRTVAENAWRVFRDHLILEYEIPKYEGDWAPMNLFVGLSEAEAREKVELLLQSFPSRACHRWWNRETLLGIMHVRGMEANVACAEAFVARKLVI